MNGTMYKMDCGDHFKVESEDKDEVKKMAKMHARDKDGMDVSDNDLEEKIEEV